MTLCVTKTEFDEHNADLALALAELDSRLQSTEDYIACKQTSFKFAVIADAPTIGLNAAKDLIAAQMLAMGVDNVFYIGNISPVGSYSADLDSSLLPYQYWIDKEALFPVMAESEMDNALGQTLLDKLIYTPSNGSHKRYYLKTFDDGKISFFVLNSGYDNSGPPTVVEPDGNIVGSVQYDWYRDELLNSCSNSRHKRFALFKTPFVTGADSGTVEPPKLSDPALDWEFENDNLNVIFAGQVEEIHRRESMKIASICHATASTVDLVDALTGSNLGLIEEYRAAPGDPAIPSWIFLDIRENLTLLQLVKSSDGSITYSTIL